MPQAGAVVKGGFGGLWREKRVGTWKMKPEQKAIGLAANFQYIFA